MKTLKEKLLEMLSEDLTKDEQHQLTMELFEHHTYTKEKAYVEGYRSAVAELLDNYLPTPVKEFHEVFEHPVKTTPKVPLLNSLVLSVKLVVEEALEYAEACHVIVHADVGKNVECYAAEDSEPDIVAAADALGDLRYVVDGANLRWGFPQEEILYEIHNSNMSKLGEDGKPIYREDGKILKGPNFRLPDIAGILKEHGLEE